MTEPAAESSPVLGRAALGEYGGELALACGEALGKQLERPVEIALLDVHAVPARAVVEGDEALVDQLFLGSGTPPTVVHAVLPVPLACALAALSRRLEGDDLAAASSGPFDAEAGGALASAMRAVADGVQGTLGACGLAELEVRDAREIPEPAEDPSWLEAEGYLRVRLRLTGAEPAEGNLDLLFPDALGEADEALEAQCVCFLAADDGGRRELAELSRDLGYRAVPIDPEELLGEPDERLLGAAAVVVPFDLSGRAGLEWVETLAADPSLADVPILAASPRPTRAQLWAAMRAGARSLVFQPYDPQELRRRIEATPDPAATEASDA